MDKPGHPRYAAAMDLEMKHLQLVLAIADHRTLTKAGLQLHLTQSALSHQLRDLEGRYQRALFTRTVAGMVPTAAGRVLIDTARAVLPQVSAAEQGLRDEAAARMLLRVTTECYTCYHWLPQVIAGLQKTAPAVEVSINVAATPAPLEALLRDDIDVAIMSSVPRQRSITRFPLFDDELVLVVPATHRLAKTADVNLRELRRETLLIYGPVANSHLLSRVLAPAGIVPAAIKEMQLTEAIIEMIKAGLGVGVLARWAIHPHLAAGSVKGLRIGKNGYRRTWHAVVRNRLRDADYVRSFVQLAAAAAPGSRRWTARANAS
jgi:LysR family transcriptional regulator for metE and metH